MGIAKLMGREVDGDVGCRSIVIEQRPATRRADGFVQSKRAELEYQVALLGQWNEDVGRDRPAYGMLPTHQRLEANDPGGLQVNDGLVIHRDLIRT